MAAFVEQKFGTVGTAASPLRNLRRAMKSKPRKSTSTCPPNVGNSERVLSAAAGAALALVGLRRKDLSGLLIAGLGGALLYRGASGRCSAYSMLGVSTAESTRTSQPDSVDVAVSYLINKPAGELYAFWRDFERLPEFMSHLTAVEKLDARRSHWTTTAPWLYGGQVEWEAEIIEDELDRRIVWQSLPGAEVRHRGSIEFAPALGDRGTMVRVHFSYAPPLGRLGRWAAKLFGEEPEQQVREDLRNFKRLMEVGEIPTIEGQPQGKCR